MQKISSIHKLIFKIKQIVGSIELNSHAYFWPQPPKNHLNYFWLSWCAPACKKISSFDLFIFDLQSVLKSRDHSGCTHFWSCRPNFFWSTFDVCEFVSTWKNSSYFNNFFRIYGCLENPAIWFAENTVAHFSGTKLFLKMGFVQEHSANNVNFH